MGGSNALGVDIDALRTMAATLRASASTLDRQSRRIAEHPFGIGNDQAGRNYSGQGTVVHNGLARIASSLRNWSAAAAATADVFDHAATEYARIDRNRAAGLPGARR
ncbi:hypothetical protein [Nocardia crassostreae]|uniref:hypothetical protein n=1 Tax=Nocardia crassostreae TaxID=53428 RepID=UPI00082A5254|nr:hypothetical protein [Nocardia crassostreae]